MPHSRRIYEMMPMYAQIADELGILQHLCDLGIQPQLDIAYRILRIREYFYDPDNPAASPHLDWLGQFVGLGKIKDHYLGVGINPEWENIDKRNLINAAWKYWQAKGTEKGIRLAITLWLLWDKSKDPRILEIRQPLGELPCKEPPNWVTYGTRYDHFRTQPFKQLQRLGWGDIPKKHQATYKIFEKPGDLRFYGSRYGNLEINLRKPKPRMEIARQGSFYPWMHFNELSEEDWHKIFPDIFELNPEIWIATAKPTVIGWFHFPAKELILKSENPPEPPQYKKVFDCDGVHYGDKFEPLIAKRKQTTTQRIKWTIWDKSCHYGDPWGFTKKRFIKSLELNPMISCYNGDFYGTVSQGIKETIETKELPARFYYGDGTIITHDTSEQLVCKSGIWYNKLSGQSKTQLVGCQILTSTPYSISPPIKQSQGTSRSLSWGERYFNQGNTLPTYQKEIPEETGITISAIPSFGFWNSLYPWHYFNLSQTTIRDEHWKRDLIQLCHQTRRYSSRTLSLVSKTELSPKLKSLSDTYPLLKSACDTENWLCQISTEMGWLVCQPISLMTLANPDWATAKRSTAISKDFPYLLIEFLIQPEQDTHAASLSLLLNQEPVESRCFDKPIFLSTISGFGVRALLKLID